MPNPRLSSLLHTTNAAGELAPYASGEQSAPGDPGEAVANILSRLPSSSRDRLTGIGHRIVFGGRRYIAPVFADAEVLGELERLVPIEPLHLRAELDLVYATGRHLPGIPQVLCLDTAFHRSAPEIARRTTLPHDIDPLIERYGFHGLSYEYVASQLPQRGAARPHAARHDDGIQRAGRTDDGHKARRSRSRHLAAPAFRRLR